MDTKNPFDSDPFGSPPKTTEEARKDVTGEAERLLHVARGLEGQANLAKASGDAVWLHRVQGLANKLLKILWEFTKKAIMLAVFNFIQELCTMILNAAMEALTKTKATLPKPPTQGPPPSTEYGDPFTRRYSPITW